VSLTDNNKPRVRLPARPESLAEVVHEAIRTAIMERRLAPGARLIESELAQELDVSKTPVREALVKLRQIGLIVPDGPRTLRVVQPSRRVITEAYELREALEVFSAGAVAGRCGAEELATIREAAERALEGARAGSHEQFRSWDLVFHRAIASATGNRMLEEKSADTFSLLVTLRQRDVPPSDFSVSCAEAHLRVIAAIEAGDVEGSRSAMCEHVRQVRDHVLETFPEIAAEA
jgi:GntR family transcriptional regulator, rspAB operon transcriptional repressor